MYNEMQSSGRISVEIQRKTNLKKEERCDSTGEKGKYIIIIKEDDSSWEFRSPVEGVVCVVVLR